ncbi:MAG: hypothetical protein GY759_06895 [Chloroflexi bacterium]|nr:hypothetical protein [Chloroflexota bacterium]
MPIHDPVSRLLIIGLDGGTWDILGPLCDLGEMPNLARLRSRGAWGTLNSTQPPYTAPAWSSIVTGVNPGRHGVLNFIRKPQDPVRSLQNLGVPVNSTDIRATTIWRYFNAAGKRVGHVNFPLSYPLQAVDDFAVSGMLTPPDASDWTHPHDLAQSLDSYVIELDYGRPGKALAPEDLPDPGAMLQDIARMTERRGYHALRMIQQRQWDIFGIVFTGTDRIFHHYWHYLQPNAPEASSRLEIALSEQLRRYFHLLDSVIGSLVRSGGGDTNIVLISDHGFGPAAKQWAHLNNWLLERDLLRLKAGTTSWMQRIKRHSPWLRDVAKQILPREARAAVKQHGNLADAIDWTNTLAWAEPLYNNVAGIYLHRANRYADAPVSPAAAEPLQAKLMKEALRLHIPETNRPLIIDIQPKEALYPGPNSDTFPELILTLDPAYSAVPTLGTTLITPIKTPLRSGDHRPEGIFLAYGPNIHSGALDDAADLIDLAPTLLHCMGIPAPRNMEGHVIGDIFTDGYLVLHPPRKGEDIPFSDERTDLSAQDADAVAQRLQGLGYLSEDAP